MKSQTPRNSDCWPPKNFRVVTALRNSAVPTLRVYPRPRRKLRTMRFLDFFALHHTMDDRTWKLIYQKRTGHSYGE